MTVRIAALLGFMLLGATATGSAASAVTTPPSSRPTLATTLDTVLTDSQQTRTVADGPFAGLSVTVGKTADLTDEAVYVTWSGAQPTRSNGSVYLGNYLQVFQCWGDPNPDGTPATDTTREQCGVGGGTQSGSSPPFANADTFATFQRTVQYGPGYDPLDTGPVLGQEAVSVSQPRLDGTGAYTVPVRSVVSRGLVNGTINLNSAFNGSSTNEQPYLASNASGTGETFFSMQALSAPWMGCTGTVAVQSREQPRPCFLVVVPRGTVETNGEAARNGLNSSPLSASNWANRIVFPLSFQPSGLRCGDAPTRVEVLGSTTPDDLFQQWSPTLCAGGTYNFDYADVPEFTGGAAIAGGRGSVVFTDSPSSVAGLARGRPLIYAPITVSATGVAFLDQQRFVLRAGQTAEQVKAATGIDVATATNVRAGTLALSPRLVAKLLTQSYQYGAFLGAPSVEKNLVDVVADEEFLALNPTWRYYDRSTEPAGSVLTANTVGDITLSKGPTATITPFLSWIDADADARAFLDGAPYRQAGPGGAQVDAMAVNPAYKGVRLSAANYFQQLDATRTPDLYALGKGLGPNELHPVAGSFDTAASLTSQGTNNAQQACVDVDEATGVKTPCLGRPYRTISAVGFLGRFLTFTDTPSAANYALPMASLQAPSGRYVAPTVPELQAAVAGMQPLADLPGVLDTTTAGPDSYCCSNVTYAVIDPSAMSAEQRRGAAELLRYAAGPGQVPGTSPGSLPVGYAPLPDGLKAQTVAAAQALIDYVPPPSPAVSVSASPSVAAPVVPVPVPVAAEPVPSPEQVATPRVATPPSPVPPRRAAATPPASPPAPAAGVPAEPQPVAAPPVAAPLDIQEAAAPRSTPLAGSPLQWVVPTVVLTGLAAAVGGPLLLALGRRKGTHA